MICRTTEEIAEQLSVLQSYHRIKLSDENYKDNEPIVVFTSCPADPLTRGHIALLKASAEFGDILMVCVNSNEFLIRKKGYYFLDVEDRMAVIDAIGGVDIVFPFAHETQFVDEAIREWKVDVVCKGGDYSEANMAECEIKAAMDVGATIKYGVGGYSKISSSSELVKQGCQRLIDSIYGDESCHGINLLG